MYEFLLLVNLLVQSFVGNVLAVDDEKAIVGGEEVEKGRYPYQVALVFNNGDLVCGGSLVDKDWVLSAAHCKGIAAKVSIGSHDLTLSEEENREEIEIACEIDHPSYNKRTFDNDFMMIKLTQSSTYSPVKLDDGSSTLDDGVDLTVMGWGTTSSGGEVSPVLLEAETDYVTNSQCESDYPEESITSNMMCAARDGIDSCQGDSGGPLIIKGNDTSADVQVGVVSWGYGCADPEYPGVYAQVSSQIDWINDQISSGTRSEGGGAIISGLTGNLFKLISKLETGTNDMHLRH